jgi:hypothetical protein
MGSFLKREIQEGVQGQGASEAVVYTITTTPWMTGPLSATAKIEQYQPTTRLFTDVTATCMAGSCTINGDVITLPVVSKLTEGEMYLVSVAFSKGANTLEAVAWVQGEH